MQGEREGEEKEKVCATGVRVWSGKQGTVATMEPCRYVDRQTLESGLMVYQVTAWSS